MPEELSLSQARRVALRAQGLDRRRRTGGGGMRALQQVVDRLGVVQIDSVNVLARAHLMPTFSRVGPYDVGLLDRAAGRRPRRLVETWAHEASYVPPTTYPLLGWRRRAYRDQAWGLIAEVPMRHSTIVAEVRELVTKLHAARQAAASAGVTAEENRKGRPRWRSHSTTVLLPATTPPTTPKALEKVPTSTSTLPCRWK